jgi:hypothetical protein
MPADKVKAGNNGFRLSDNGRYLPLRRFVQGNWA